MKSCSVVPSENEPPSPACVQFLLDNYVFIKRIGKGEMSVIARLDSTTPLVQQIVVKIMPLDVNARQDLSIACQLNSLAKETPVFVHTWGWIACGEIPADWKRFMFALPMGVDWSLPTFIYQVMDYAPESWADKGTSFLAEEYESMLFLLLHGLYTARKELGSFSHNDIHEGQVLLQPCKPKTVITCRVEGNLLEVVCERFVPKLIDFGMASSKSHPYSSSSSSSDEENVDDDDDDMFESSSSISDSSDVKDLLILFETRMRKDKVKTFKRSKWMEEALISQPEDYNVIAKVLLNDFKMKKGKEMIGRRCMVCAEANANYVWKGTDIYFCGLACEGKRSVIGGLVNL